MDRDCRVLADRKVRLLTTSRRHMTPLMNRRQGLSVHTLPFVKKKRVCSGCQTKKKKKKKKKQKTEAKRKTKWLVFLTYRTTFELTFGIAIVDDIHRRVATLRAVRRDLSSR
jgi:hypothetical protein